MFTMILGASEEPSLGRPKNLKVVQDFYRTLTSFEKVPLIPKCVRCGAAAVLVKPVAGLQYHSTIDYSPDTL